VEKTKSKRKLREETSLRVGREREREREREAIVMKKEGIEEKLVKESIN
jgi:hypothetical protein